MRVYKSGDTTGDCVVLLGMFDGVHLGHMTLVEKAVSLKHTMGLPVIMYTFDQNPMPDKKRLMSAEDKIRICEGCGVDGIYFESFSESFRKTAPGAFVKDILSGRLSAKAVVVGSDYRFGFKGAGSCNDLYGNGFEVYVMPKLEIGGLEVSSSLIRELLEQGNVTRASELLGYEYSLTGRVVHGRGVGRSFGVCTANIDVDSSFVIPGDGVYITKIFVNNRWYPSLTNVGFKPTFGLDYRSIEVHILDFDGDLYGDEARLEFVEYLRDERVFSDVNELKAQIDKDIIFLRRYYERGFDKED